MHSPRSCFVVLVAIAPCNWLICSGPSRISAYRWPIPPTRVREHRACSTVRRKSTASGTSPRDPDTNKIQRITFTSEPPEYWQALFGFVPGGGDIPNASFPGDQDVLLELYRTLVSPEVRLEDLVAVADTKHPSGDLLARKGRYNIYNKWNTTHGIAHLNSPPNSLVAEIQLGGDATVLHNDPRGRLLVEPDALICYAGYGGPNRNSDPTIGATVNALARLGAYVTLRNPIGLYMDHIDLSGWQAPTGETCLTSYGLSAARPA